MAVQNSFGFIFRRRRYFLLKLFALFFIVLTLLIWTRVSHNRNGDEKYAFGAINADNYQKADGPILVNRKNEEEALEDTSHEKKIVINQKKKKSYQLSKRKILDEKEKRRIVNDENMDEFLVPVLENYKFEEIDLNPIRNAPYSEYDEDIKNDFKKVIPGLGEGGNKAEVPKFQKDAANNIRKKEAFNLLLSEMISPNRTAPDTREESCKYIDYDKDLPNMSVIIIYTNEAFTSLTRTIHSVINTTPRKLLREIILVDDFSDRTELKGKFERYIATQFPFGTIRLIKLKQRAGLIRARMIGAHEAFGDVLLFLDAHCETGIKWSEPILQRIKEDRTAVVCPIIDVIDDNTLEYYHGNGKFFQIGGFTWSGHFTWINIPEYEKRRKKHHHSPTRSPTMAGGLFGIDRKYFWEIGSYDSDMQLWGGENLEMSFRIWQCGGSVEIIPCSRVGHIFRNFHPYSFPNNVDSHGLNTARLAEVWMDEYKELFYSHRMDLKTAAFGDVGKRISFRKRSNCKSFKWFLDNIYQEKFQMQFASKLIGQVKNVETSQCLDNMQNAESQEYTLGVYPCHPVVYSSQTFLISNDNHLRRENECATNWTNDVVRMIQCENIDEEAVWKINGDLLVNEKSKKCLTVVSSSQGGFELKLSSCGSAPNQKWIFIPKDKNSENEI